MDLLAGLGQAEGFPDTLCPTFRRWSTPLHHVCPVSECCVGLQRKFVDPISEFCSHQPIVLRVFPHLDIPGGSSRKIHRLPFGALLGSRALSVVFCRAFFLWCCASFLGSSPRRRFDEARLELDQQEIDALICIDVFYLRDGPSLTGCRCLDE
jgi:hypothetical protein